MGHKQQPQNKRKQNPDHPFHPPDPVEYSKSLNLNTDNNLLATNPFPKILGLNFDPKLTFSERIKYTKTYK